MSVRILIKDLYESFAELFTPFNEDMGTMTARVEDWMLMTGDTLQDESAEMASRKLRIFLENVGYPIEKDSGKIANNNIIVDLVSGEIFPSYTQTGSYSDISRLESSIQNAMERQEIEESIPHAGYLEEPKVSWNEKYIDDEELSEEDLRRAIQEDEQARAFPDREVKQLPYNRQKYLTAGSGG